MTYHDTGLSMQIIWWSLALVSAIIWLIAWRRRWRSAPGVRFPTGHRMAGVKRGLRAHLVHFPLVIRLLALGLVLVALARPQLTEAETAEVEGIDIVVAFDMSLSMEQVDMSDEEMTTLQNKGKEPTNRFVNAVEVLREFVESRRYDRVSLVIFGKEAFLQFPLTLDYGVMLHILSRMKLGDIDGTGTAIGNALGMSMARLRESEAKTKLIILITDGEDNGSRVSPTEMAKEAAKESVRVFPILVGSEDQTWRPTQNIDPFTNQRRYEKANNQVNPALLEEIAELANGKFYRATDKAEFRKEFFNILDEFEKSRLVDFAAAERTEVFHWFLWPALLLAFLEILLSQVVLRRFP